MNQREDDRQIAHLIERLEFYIVATAEWRERHDASAKEFRDDINRRLAPVEEWVNTANSSWKLIVGTVTITGLLFKAWTYIQAHFK